MKKYFILAGVISIFLTSCDPKTQQTIIKTGQDILNAANGTTGSTAGLTNAEVVKGLKEALSVGAKNSTALTSQLDGFNKNPLIFIPWPEEAVAMKEKLAQLGFQKQITDFETSLNRAAEEASKNATPVFVNAITNMSISDGFAILNGNDTAATHYLREKTSAPLRDAFSPVVGDAIDQVKVTAYWGPLIEKYNLIPGVKQLNPDLKAYVTQKAINGLMTMIAKEEVKIRKDPMARVTDLLKKVFGSKK
jgi:hypothetical protein